MAWNPVSSTLRIARDLIAGSATKDLDGTDTHENLLKAFSLESQANRRYLFFAKIADLEGHPEIAGLFRDTADGETGHALGMLEYLRQLGDPATGKPIGTTSENLHSASAGESFEETELYPEMAKKARDEGFPEIAQWFDILAKAERSHAETFKRALDKFIKATE